MATGKVTSSPTKSIPSYSSSLMFITFPDLSSSQIPEDPDAKQFLTASEGVRQFLSQLGRKLFSPITSDIKGNIDKIDNILQQDSQLKTLGDILRKEESLTHVNKVGTDALLWLTRALDFVLLFLTFWLQDYQSNAKKEDLTRYFRCAYDSTLKPYHNWFVKKIVDLILAAAPTREQLLTALLVSSPNDTNCEDGGEGEEQQPKSTNNNRKEESPKKLADSRELDEEQLFRELEQHVNLLRINIDCVRKLFDSVSFNWRQ